MATLPLHLELELSRDYLDGLDELDVSYETDEYDEGDDDEAVEY